MDVPLDLEALLARVASGARVRYVLFWGHEGPREGVDASCLSQWFPAPFEVKGITYPTAEHFMMAEKARLFGDREAEDEILAAPHPGAAKRLGRRVRGFDEEVWSRARSEIVVRGNEARFSQHAPLREFLLGTNTRVLVEASPVDRIWGIGLTACDPAARDPAAWRGLNLLGFALMAVRYRFHTT